MLLDPYFYHVGAGNYHVCVFYPNKSKWIFVMSSKKLYAGKKSKGAFHHLEFPCRWGCFIYHGLGKAEIRKNNLGDWIFGSVPYRDIWNSNKYVDSIYFSTNGREFGTKRSR